MESCPGRSKLAVASAGGRLISNYGSIWIAQIKKPLSFERASKVNKDVRLYTCKEAARYLAVSPRTLWGLTDNGKIRCVRIGRSVRYDIHDLDEYVDRLKSRSEVDHE